MLGLVSIIEDFDFTSLSLAMPWFLLEWWVCEWILAYSFRFFNMFLMDFDFVINSDGYFQALILRLEVGADYTYYKEVTPIIKEFDSVQDYLYLFASRYLCRHEQLLRDCRRQRPVVPSLVSPQ